MPKLILVRHGQSEWNLANRFTGWWDVDLTDKGVEEANAAGRLLARRACCRPSPSPPSRPARSRRSIWRSKPGPAVAPVTKDWRLNERHYGGLTGLDKQETRDKHGDEQVHIWRRSFDVPPPANGGGQRVRSVRRPALCRDPMCRAPKA